MRRRTPRLLPIALPERGALAALLVAWLLGVVAPACHDHADHAANAAAAGQAGRDDGDDGDDGDQAGCPACAALHQRAVVPAVSISLAPRVVVRLAPPRARASLPSERSVFAQARGPPAAAASLVTRDRSSTTAPSRA